MSTDFPTRWVTWESLARPILLGIAATFVAVMAWIASMVYAVREDVAALQAQVAGFERTETQFVTRGEIEDLRQTVTRLSGSVERLDNSLTLLVGPAPKRRR